MLVVSVVSAVSVVSVRARPCPSVRPPPCPPEIFPCEATDLLRVDPEPSARHADTCSTMPKCDRCDAAHLSTECPHYRWARGKHADARCMPVEERPELVPDVPPVEATGKLEKQPGDGSCMYHSLACGLTALGWEGTPHTELRRELAMWIKANGTLQFNGKTVLAWSLSLAFS